jgi:hypothetical protein
MAEQGSRRPVGVTALSLFFVFGTAMAAVAALSLAFPGSVLEPMWRLNPQGHQGLVRLDVWGVVLMVATSVGCGVSALGLWRRRRWGYAVAVSLLVVQLAGDILNVVLGTEPRAIVGVPIVAGLLLYLSRASIRATFRSGGS